MKYNKPNALRSGKGQSIIKFPDEYTIIDIETTGLDPRYCEIIEVSAIKYANNSITDRFTSLVKPSEPIDDYISQLTGITNKMLETAPITKDILPLFFDFISDSILIGYNVNFDINFLYDNLLPLNIILSNSFIDVLRIARRLLPNLKNHKLITVADYFNVTPSIYHRGLADCETCQNCYRKMKEEIHNKHIPLDTFSTKKKNLKASDITTNTKDFDISHPLYNKVCVFTGKLERMTRKEAMQNVVDIGGICADNVTKKTNYLILGNDDFCKSIKNGKSNKQKKAEQISLDGGDIQILSENVFYELLED